MSYVSLDQDKERTLSPSKQAKIQFNQVSNDSPFRKKREDTSSDESESFDRISPVREITRNRERFSKGHNFDDKQFYNKLQQEEKADRMNIRDQSVFINCTGFQGVMMARGTSPLNKL